MKQFYEQLRTDLETRRFFALCPICGKKQHGGKIPLLCRSRKSLAQSEAGRGNRLSRWAFNHAKANATQLLAIQFNQCRHCYRWVCDACYDSTDPLGACRDCSEKGRSPRDATQD